MEPEAAHERSELKLLDYKCPGCGFSNKCAVFPWHPFLAKHHCSYCGRENTVQSRESSNEQLEALVDENKEVAHYKSRGRAYSISRQQIRDEVEMVRRRTQGPVKTPFGDALIIDP